MALPRRLRAKRSASDAMGLLHVIEGLVETVNDHDIYTAGHSTRVSSYAAALAAVAGLPPDQVGLLRRAGLVHDIGKIGVPDKVLNKAEPLTDEEFQLIRLHPLLGASILARTPEMRDVVPLVLHHHERWDGGGYPSGLVATDIPRGARIMFVVDAFDAMTTERPYGRVFDEGEALDELRRHAGAQFDPTLVHAMHEAHRLGLLETDERSPISLLG